MSTHLEAERKDLKDLVKRAAAKENRILRFSIVFTVLVIAGGFAWIVYSAKRVINLEQRRAALETTNQKLDAEIGDKTKLLHEVNSEIERSKAAATKIAAGSSDAKQEARDVLASLSNAQQRVQTAIDDSPRNRGENPVVVMATPTPVPATDVPDLKGLTLSAARQKLRQSGLSLTLRVQEGRGTPGTVLYQDPPANWRVKVGSSVSVFVIPVQVPEVRSLTAAAATQKLRDAGFDVTEKAQPGRGVPGTVLYQDPVAGTRLPAGAAVSIYVIPPRQTSVQQTRGR